MVIPLFRENKESKIKEKTKKKGSLVEETNAKSLLFDSCNDLLHAYESHNESPELGQSTYIGGNGMVSRNTLYKVIFVHDEMRTSNSSILGA